MSSGGSNEVRYDRGRRGHGEVGMLGAGIGSGITTWFKTRTSTILALLLDE
jgi:hypothetical protein